jgi:phosphoribosyl 1,2-cyclic phosphodiesterase
LPLPGPRRIVKGVAVQFTVLGSGSGGNSAYVETGETRLLIDAGFSARQLRQRLASIGRSPETLTGILITHEHADHIQGLAVLCAQLPIPIYCNRFTRDIIVDQFKTKFDFRLFSTGAAFALGDVQVESFSVPHDAQDPVGFLLRTDRANLGLVTDLGHVTRLVIERMRPANVLLLEANHDVQMLQNDPKRPWSLKQRILSRHGHLSNDAAADATEQIASAHLQKLYLGHLSRDCNRPELARHVISDRLLKIGATHVCVETMSQDAPNATLTL